MSNIQRSNFQAHPFHLVSPSPWPLFSSISLLTLTTSAVSTFHGFSNAGYVLGIALVTLVYTMSLWFRDIISEGRVWLKRTILSIYNLNIAKAIPSKEVEKALDNYKANNNHYKLYANDNKLGYYLAGLLEQKKITLGKIYTFKVIPVTVSMIQIRKKSSRKLTSTCTDMVVWGVNLSSGFTTRKLSNIELNMFKFPHHIRSIIVGLLLSDGWLSYPSVNNKYPRLGFEQTSAQSSYLWSVYWALSHYCYSLPKYKARTRNNVPVSSWTLSTRGLPCFVEFYKIFYSTGKKVIPQDIYNLLTPIALAHMIMGDGSAVSKGLRISTDDFTAIDVVRLINVLIIKYRLDCTLHITNNKPRIYIKHKSVKLLESIVKPYIVPSMEYKFNKSLPVISENHLCIQKEYIKNSAPFNRKMSTYLVPQKIEQENTAVLLNKQNIKEISAKNIIPSYLFSIFISLLLSSGWANIHNKTKSKARIKFRQPYENKEYLYHIFREISIYCDKDPYRFTSGPLFKGKPVDEMLIVTRWLYCFIEIYSMFYNKNEKRVPHNIYDLINPYVLAHWIRGSSVRLQGRGLILCTDYFSISDVVKLINVLIIKYRLQCNLLLVKGKPRIYIYRSCMDNLMIIIKPYILSSVKK